MAHFHPQNDSNNIDSNVKRNLNSFCYCSNRCGAFTFTHQLLHQTSEALESNCSCVIPQEVWRIFMLPINFFFLSVRPVVDMRVWVHDPAVDGPRPGATATGGKAKKMVCLEAVSSESNFSSLGSVYKRGSPGCTGERLQKRITRLHGQRGISYETRLARGLAAVCAKTFLLYLASLWPLRRLDSRKVLCGIDL